MKVLIIYPNTPSARTLGIKLMEWGHSVTVFCPDEEDKDFAENLINELKLVGEETDQLRGVRNSFSVLKEHNFSGFAIIVIPCLDVQPEQSDLEYSAMCQYLFKNMKENDCSFDRDSQIIFGWNFGGLIAAAKFGIIFPETRNQIFVTSSIFSASIKVYGHTTQVRAIPIARSPVKLAFTTSQPLGKMKNLEGMWDIDSYPVLEHRSLWEVVSTLVKGNDLQSSAVEILGRFPTEEEAEIYKIPVDIPAWLPSGAEDLPCFEKFFSTNKMLMVCSFSSDMDNKDDSETDNE